MWIPYRERSSRRTGAAILRKSAERLLHANGVVLGTSTVPRPARGGPRPRGGDWLDDEMSAWRRVGIDVVVSLLTPDEVAEFELEREADAARNAGIGFHSLPVADRDVPASRSAFRGLVTEVARELTAGRRVVVHCRQGIGRAGLLAAGLLVAAGATPDEAVAKLTAARGRPVPETPAQRHWLDAFADEVLTAAGTTGAAREGREG